jgi:hypothetical protein
MQEQIEVQRKKTSKQDTRKRQRRLREEMLAIEEMLAMEREENASCIQKVLAAKARRKGKNVKSKKKCTSRKHKAESFK